jgi:hypothetical protein
MRTERAAVSQWRPPGYQQDNQAIGGQDDAHQPERAVPHMQRAPMGQWHDSEAHEVGEEHNRWRGEARPYVLRQNIEIARGRTVDV